MIVEPNRRFLSNFASWALTAWLACWLTSAPAFADDRDDIQTAYKQTYKAAALKYRFGMHAHRSADFKAYDADGLLVDPQTEQAWLSSFLHQALSVKETGSILKFEQITDDKVQCEVLDTIEATVVPDAREGAKNQVVIKTRSLDEWHRTGKGWQQAACRVIEQTYESMPVRP